MLIFMTDNQQNIEIKSPCTHVCTLDFDTGYCYGCGRNVDEITNWGKYDDTERQKIIDNLPNRLQEIEDSI